MSELSDKDVARIETEADDAEGQARYERRMTEFRDLSDLPKAAARVQGHPPDAESRFGSVLVDAWDKAADDEKPNAVQGARFRHSDAGGCSRAIAYAALKLPVSNPMDAPSHFITTLGSKIHEFWQEALKARYGDHVEVEVKVGEDDRGGHVDAVVKLPTGNTRPHIIAIEFKSVGGFAYKLAIGDRGPAKGASYSHQIQAALNGRAVDADETVVVYVSRDAVSIQQAERKDFDALARVTAEWTYSREVYEPIADKEIWRVTRILKMLDEGTLPSRKIPDPELSREIPAKGELVITNPLKGEWVAMNADGAPVNAGTTWQCRYCRYQTTCAMTGAHREPVDVLVQLGALNAEAQDGGSREQ